MQIRSHALEIVAYRARRVRQRLWSTIRRELVALGARTEAIERVADVLDLPYSQFRWIQATVESSDRYRLADPAGVAENVVLHLAALEGGIASAGARYATDLLDEYVLTAALAAVGAPLTVAPRVLARRTPRRQFRATLATALSSFVAHVQANVTHERVTPREDVTPGAVRGAIAARGAAWRLERAPWDVRAFGRYVLLASWVVLALLALLVVVYPEARTRLPRVSPVLWLGVGLVSVVVAVGAALGHRAALLVSMLFGVPRELPWHVLPDERVALRRKAAWLARFLEERPRGYNTPGAHRACGLMATKTLLKKACLQREREDALVRSLKRRRAAALALRATWSRRVGRALAAGEKEAASYSRKEHAVDREFEAIERLLFHQQLQIQDAVVAAFVDEWRGVHARGRVPTAVYEAVLRELRQPEGEPPALLPNGLVRGPLAYVFEYGMFTGRMLLTVMFLATFQVSHLGWAALLFVLELYVIEPVVMKLHVSSLNLAVDSPGHPSVDLAKYIEENVPEGGVFRVPITVPKFSSNPAWTNLNAILQAASATSGVKTTKVTPFAMREGRRDTVLEVGDGPGRDALRSAEMLRDAVVAGLAAGVARFPLRTEVRAERGRVVVSLTDTDEAIWELIGEDASQAFLYLHRNLRALRDTLAHLGPKFQPVFILASNTKDPDAIQYEMDHVGELQALSDREHGGQVGFLYLLRGGAWHNHNAYLRKFEASDKELAKAVPYWRKLLASSENDVHAYLLSKLLAKLDEKAFADAFNEILADDAFYDRFARFDFDALEPHVRPAGDTLALLERRRAGAPLTAGERRVLNRELLLTVLPMRSTGDFFKKVGNDIPVQELLVAGKTTPTMYTDRRTSEHVQEPGLPNYVRLRGDFARYTGLKGTNDEIHAAILAGKDLEVESVPEVGAVLDDKNELGPGEVEKGLATMLHPLNRHIVIGVPRIGITFPEHKGRTVLSEYIVAAQGSREIHNSADGQSRTRVFDASSPAYGKWWKRPAPYLAHYAQEVLNAAHALSHDFQQSYFVAGASGRLAGFSEALYGPSRFKIRELGRGAKGGRRWPAVARAAVAVASTAGVVGVLGSLAYAVRAIH